jgi:hypothetical protein
LEASLYSFELIIHVDLFFLTNIFAFGIRVKLTRKILIFQISGASTTPANATLPIFVTSTHSTLKIVVDVVNLDRRRASIAASIGEENVANGAQSLAESFEPSCIATTERDGRTALGPFLSLFLLNWLSLFATRMTTQFTKLFSFILANVADPPRQEFEMGE